MKKLNMLLCTIVFVLMSACQDQSGLVQDVRPLEVSASIPVFSNTDIEQATTVDPEEQLIGVYTGILTEIFVGMSDLDEAELTLLSTNPGATLQWIEHLANSPELGDAIQSFTVYYTTVVIQDGDEYARQILIDVAADVIADIIMEDSGQVALNAGECFDRLQVDQAALWAAYLSCMLAAAPTGFGSLICWAGLAAGTAINLKRFKDCVRN